MKATIGNYPGARRWYHKLTGTSPKHKIDIKIDEWDIWSMDYTLSLIIHPMLLKLKAASNSSADVDDADVPSYLRSTAAPALSEKAREQGEVDANYHERWTWVLNEMIWAFEQCSKESDLTSEDEWNRLQNGYTLFGKYYGSLWD